MRRVLLGLPAAVLLLSACGDPTTPGRAGATTVPASPSVTASPSSSLPPSDVPPPVDGSSAPSGSPGRVDPAPAPGRQITVEGVVEPGVEAGCKILTTPSGSYLLLGSDEQVPLGVRVRIRGEALTSVSTTCQQGTPLRVISVTRR
ncbi:MAG TPA: hypothetical protein VF109_05865 [Mycobacteriales bacterium]